MKTTGLLLLASFLAIPAFAIDVSEQVYVETKFDTDKDGQLDRIYVSINRPNGSEKFSTILEMSPYALGGTEVPMHNVDMDQLPQDSMLDTIEAWSKGVAQKFKPEHLLLARAEGPRYANLKAHSLGTGYSSGCPSVGDETEALAGAAVIDWLNGRARAFDKQGKEVVATWANGKVGMTGISYDGTLPIMIAATGVEGLKAIVPIAAISNWYDYYRANGLVVSPGGYIGEDADILGYYIVRRGACQSVIEQLTREQGREHGDFSPFWQVRNHLAKASHIKAATFIIHGQNDWNVKQKHAIQLWEALEGVTTRRLFLHKGAHGSTYMHNVPGKIQAWFDHFLEGVDNGITDSPQVEVELPTGELMVQNEWPSEATTRTRLFFHANARLAKEKALAGTEEIQDSGSSTRLESLIAGPESRNASRLVFQTEPLAKETVLSGTAQVQLQLALLNRHAANITVAIVAYSSNGTGRVITRGWADPQNYADLTQGESLVQGKSYTLSFPLEPKQAKIPAGSRLAVIVTSTDYDYTLRPKAGTRLQLTLGTESFIDLNI